MPFHVTVLTLIIIYQTAYGDTHLTTPQSAEGSRPFLKTPFFQILVVLSVLSSLALYVCSE